MTAVSDEEDIESALDEMTGAEADARKIPVKRTRAKAEAAQRRAEEKKAQAELAAATSKAQARAAQLAQIVNLHIAGHSYADIGAQIGMTGDEIERMINTEAARYVRTQPALRNYVRHYISGKYSELLENVWARATDDTHKENLEAHDRATRILDRMARLHGAEAPVQKEVKIESSPEAVEKVVEALARASGRGYDPTVFDVEVVEENPVSALREIEARALEVSGNDPDFDETDGEAL